MTRFVSKLCLAAFLSSPAFSALAVAPPHGKAQLRASAVFPSFRLTIGFNFNFQGREWRVSDCSPEDEIAQTTGLLTRRPDDIDQILRLAWLLNLNGRTNEARLVWQKAESLCQEKTAAGSENGLWLLRHAEALDGLDKNQAAERAYRESVSVSPGDWRCWAGLGLYLEAQSCNLLASNKSAIDAKEPGASLPSPETFAKSDDLSAEAARCFARAATTGETETEYWMEHAGYSLAAVTRDSISRELRSRSSGEKTNIAASYFSVIAPDLRKAGALNPRDYRWIAFPAYCDVVARMTAAHASGQATANPLQSLPDATRRSVRDAMSRLGKLAEDADHDMAAGALEWRGLLEFVLEDSSQAESDFRRSVALDPTRDQPWDCLLGCVKDSASSDQTSALCEARLKTKDSVHNHFLYAKLLEGQGNWSKATEQTQAALKLEPDNIPCRLMLLALTIRQGADDDFFASSVSQADAIAKLMDNMPDGPEKSDRQRELYLNGVILNALSDSPDANKKAQADLDAFLRMYPSDDTALKIRDAMQ